MHPASFLEIHQLPPMDGSLLVIFIFPASVKTTRNERCFITVRKGDICAPGAFTEDSMFGDRHHNKLFRLTLRPSKRIELSEHSVTRGNGDLFKCAQKKTSVLRYFEQTIHKKELAFWIFICLYELSIK
ncbi:hypothetical protein CDAR_593821 [Caerostris darwini]|uniref:Uncharacterized protein n=1 Tax=Caerostris darwini TaxID=1538125 RepID=A0AAV4RNI8_9ARAC|nr:hypothetical protein CDAR_593821 [Caerostris darwini]